MTRYELLMLFHSHTRTYPLQEDGAKYSTAERFADIFRQMKKAAVMLEFIDGSYIDADEPTRAEVKAELGLV